MDSHALLGFIALRDTAYACQLLQELKMFYDRDLMPEEI